MTRFHMVTMARPHSPCTTTTWLHRPCAMVMQQNPNMVAARPRAFMRATRSHPHSANDKPIQPSHDDDVATQAPHNDGDAAESLCSGDKAQDVHTNNGDVKIPHGDNNEAT